MYTHTYVCTYTYILYIHTLHTYIHTYYIQYIHTYVHTTYIHTIRVRSTLLSGLENSIPSFSILCTTTLIDDARLPKITG